jgi:hypothetical protein
VYTGGGTADENCRFTVQNNGNVGIGTTSPGGKLTIQHPSSPSLGDGLRFVSDSNYWDIQMSNAGPGISHLGFFYNSSSTPVVFFQNTGNVGIGTTQPSERLEINGTVKATKFIGDGSGLTGVSGDWTAGTGGIYYNAGNVGIGTTEPSAKLDVAGDLYLTGGNKVFKAANWVSNDIGSITNFDAEDVGFYGSAGSDLHFVTDGTERVTLKDGNVGIGTTEPQYPLHMKSGAYCSSGGVWENASSRDYKENIEELTEEEALETLNGLIPTKFNYKIDKEEKHVGFIAEDVPELVASKDRKGLSPMDIVAVLTKVVQLQQKEIEKLKAKILEKK